MPPHVPTGKPNVSAQPRNQQQQNQRYNPSARSSSRIRIAPVKKIFEQRRPRPTAINSNGHHCTYQFHTA